jgi:hypothetical protein
MDGASILKAFNDHFVDFLEDIQNVFPNDSVILTAKNALVAIRKTNPKMIIKIWREYIVSKYEAEIMNGDISFFINKDYANDLTYMDGSNVIVEKINLLRTPISNMGSENQQKCMHYIKNLTKLSKLYN